ncbi:MAG: zinc ribbon domain-containing protein [Candidatus Thorarchaeota archaeon]
MKKKVIYVYPDWEDENIKEVVIEFCRQFWGFLHVEETAPNVLKGNAQMDLGPEKQGTIAQKMAPMLIGSFTIGVDPVKGKFLKIEYEIDKGKLVHSKQILCKSYWSLVYKGLKGLLEPPYSRFEPAEIKKATAKDVEELKPCIKCGKSISISSKFCASCGAKQEIMKVEGVSAEESKPCIKCGKSISISSKFCAACGAKQEIMKVEGVSAEESKICIKCGKSISISSKFCASCGAKQEFEKLIL